MPKRLLPLIPPGLVVVQVLPTPDRVIIITQPCSPSAACPDCGILSRSIHSRYERHLGDLPWQGRPVALRVQARRFYCRNAECGRRTFAERLPDLVVPHARRTCRLVAAQARVGVALGGNAGSRLLRHLAMPASADTILRLVHGLPLPLQEAPRVVGLEWLRRGYANDARTARL